MRLGELWRAIWLWVVALVGLGLLPVVLGLVAKVLWLLVLAGWGLV